jgi:hypothetical protein
MSKSRLIVSAALALVGAWGSGLAQAGAPQLQWSLTIGSPGYVLQPAPVVVRPLPVYLPPVLVYLPPAPVRLQPVPVYPPGTYWRPTRWDRDGDGIPNRHDRLYNPRWDRDGDRLPHRYDRHDDRRWPAR